MIFTGPLITENPFSWYEGEKNLSLHAFFTRDLYRGRAKGVIEYRALKLLGLCFFPGFLGNYISGAEMVTVE